MQLPAEPSLLVSAGFLVLSLAMAGLLAIWLKRTGLVIGWVGLTGVLAWQGVFKDFALPPKLPVLLVGGLVYFSSVAWRSNWHQRPLRLLVGFQAFRILVELLIHRAVQEGVAPAQFTWTGLNWDVATGILALALLPFVDRLPRAVLHLFNLVGAGLLINVVTVALLSMPTPFQRLTPDNIWVAFFPFAWLPLILVLAAWLGHLVLFKRLLEDARASA